MAEGTGLRQRGLDWGRGDWTEAEGTGLRQRGLD